MLTRTWLRYYSKFGGTLKGEVPINGSVAVLFLEEQRQQHGFVVLSSTRRLLCRAADDPERRAWVDALVLSIDLHHQRRGLRLSVRLLCSLLACFVPCSAFFAVSPVLRDCVCVCVTADQDVQCCG